MMTEEKQVFYQTSNTYSILNQLGPKTKNIWFACHGIGFLSRYFIRYFRTLDKEQNFVIAPQAPSKYYQRSDFKYVGASWLTRENTRPESANVLAYFDAVYQAEQIPPDKNLILFGFSQGVSVMLRWMASRKIDCEMLVIYAGSLPKELTPADFTYLNRARIKVVYGDEDEYFNQDRLEQQLNFARELFGEERVEVHPFNGKHEMKTAVIERLITDFL